MVIWYFVSKGDLSEEFYLMNEEEKIILSILCFNKKSLVIFFGVMVVVVVIVVFIVMIILYFGKEWFFFVFIVKIIDCFEYVNIIVCVYIIWGRIVVFVEDVVFYLVWEVFLIFLYLWVLDDFIFKGGEFVVKCFKIIMSLIIRRWLIVFRC